MAPPGSHRVEPYGSGAVLVTCDPNQTIALLGAIDALPDSAAIVEAVPAEASILIEFDSQRTTLSRLTSDLLDLTPNAASLDVYPRVTVEVIYNGEDLAEVAAATGLSPEDVVAIHSNGEYPVAFCGFAPGFAYLTGLDKRLHLARRATPRPRVPAGSVAIAAHYSAVYPTSSPGGWHLLGSTSANLFDLDRDPPALLTPGTRMKFVPAGRLT